GYVAALHLRAMLHATGGADTKRPPRSLHVRFLSAGVEGPIEVHVQTVRAGRSVTILASRIVQNGKDVSTATAAFGAAASEVSYCDAHLPDGLPAADSCSVAPRFVPINHRVEARPVFGGPPRQAARAEAGGYVRLEEPRAPDALLLALLWDVFIPTPLLRALDARFGGAAPTIEASVYFHAPEIHAAADAFYFARFESRIAQQGYFEESSEIWGPDGTLLSTGRQLALLY
ncbi:MAG TPA: thioesterase family protein, partial [Polyangiales bacterium]|nr:thioesterase family protein [Polyangiales bacterium]